MKRTIRAALLLGALWALLLSGCGPARTSRVISDIPRNDKRAADFGLDEKGRVSYPGAVLGVDVSSHQGEIDWARVRADGVEFAILRIGFRGNTEGGLIVDERFARNYVEARQAGLKVGVYFFSQAISEEEAREEADFVLELLDGVPLELPVYYDWEEAQKGRTGGHGSSEVGTWARLFCEAVTAGGYRAGVYFNQRYGYSIMGLQNLTDYSFWLAEYDDSQSFSYQTQLWQFTGSGHVDGIDTIVDLDLMYAEDTEDEADREAPG